MSAKIIAPCQIDTNVLAYHLAKVLSFFREGGKPGNPITSDWQMGNGLSFSGRLLRADAALRKFREREDEERTNEGDKIMNTNIIRSGVAIRDRNTKLWFRCYESGLNPVVKNSEEAALDWLADVIGKEAMEIVPVVVIEKSTWERLQS